MGEVRERKTEKSNFYHFLKNTKVQDLINWG
jgi:hypothetical protein